MKKLGLLILLLSMIFVLISCQEERHEIGVEGTITEIERTRVCKGFNCDYKITLTIEYNGEEYTRVFTRDYHYEVGDTYLMYIPIEDYLEGE